jgi:RNA polymerase sigma-70 factor (ECF subfamily)
MMHPRREDKTKSAFEEVYDGVSRRLLLHLVGRMHDIDAATELWAECWAIAFASWTRCKARSNGEVEAWIFGIARNQLGHYYRTGDIRRRTIEQLQWTTPTVQENEHTELELEANLSALRGVLTKALERLPEMRARAVQLRVLEGLPYEEVAAKLSCSEQAARAHVSRGLRQLERQIDREQIADLEEAI